MYFDCGLIETRFTQKGAAFLAVWLSPLEKLCTLAVAFQGALCTLAVADNWTFSQERSGAK